MGYVTKANAVNGTEILIDTGRKQLAAVVCSLPFYIQEE
jgi:glycine cleavage system aminomethyltransferase T